MAQKIKPTVYRLGLIFPWQSRWFFRRSRRYFLEEDFRIREIVRKKLKSAGVVSVEIERVGEQLKVNIRSSRPGLIIGRGGKGVEELRRTIERYINALRRKNAIALKYALNVNIEELRRTDISAAVIAEQIAADLERLMPYRTVLKRQLTVIREARGVQGGKIKVSGRLNGAEIARSEWLSYGRLPLQNLRANIDYAEATAFTTYGTIGIKVWIYKGDIFDKE